MSYILDALKKSEQERKQGEVPGLNTLQDQPRAPRFTDLIGLYLRIGILLIIVLVAGLSMFFLRQTSSSPQAEATQELIVEKNFTAADLPQTIDAPNPLPIVKTADVEKLIPKAIPSEPDKPLPATAPPAPETETNLADVKPPPEAESDNSDLEQPPDDDQESTASVEPVLISFNDLPAEIRNMLPELTISAHYFSSKPSSRMASINGRIMRQGQTITDGLILEEIIREGVIFSFQKYRFSLEVFNR